MNFNWLNKQVYLGWANMLYVDGAIGHAKATEAVLWRIRKKGCCGCISRGNWVAQLQWPFEIN